MVSSAPPRIPVRAARRPPRRSLAAAGGRETQRRAADDGVPRAARRGGGAVGSAGLGLGRWPRRRCPAVPLPSGPHPCPARRGHHRYADCRHRHTSSTRRRRAVRGSRLRRSCRRQLGRSCRGGQRAGAATGLGLPASKATRLSPVASDKILRIGHAVAEAICSQPHEPNAESCEYDARLRHAPVDMLLAAETIADVHALLPLVRRPTGEGLRVAAVDLELLAGSSGANAAWKQADVELVPYHHLVRTIGEVGLLVVCARTGPLPRTCCRPRDSPESIVTSSVFVTAADAVHGAALRVRSTRPTETLEKIEQSLARGRPERERHALSSAGRWRGSSFPSRLPLEDGPLDAASVERLATLHDRHCGETAVIIGNGPSLNDTELELLADVADVRGQRHLPRGRPVATTDHVLRRRGHDGVQGEPRRDQGVRQRLEAVPGDVPAGVQRRRDRRAHDLLPHERRVLRPQDGNGRPSTVLARRSAARRTAGRASRSSTYSWLTGWGSNGSC